MRSRILIVTTLLAALLGTLSAAFAQNAPDTPNLSVIYGLKSFNFSWQALSNATYYRLMVSPDGVSAFTPVADQISLAYLQVPVSVHWMQWPTAHYRLDACNTAGCTPSAPISVQPGMLKTIGYFKAHNPGEEDFFGWIALSGDGRTIAVGAPGEDGGRRGVHTKLINDDKLEDTGAVYVFTRDCDNGCTNPGPWYQQAYIKASSTDSHDRFGRSLALSRDGNTLAVGAPYEASGAIATGGNQNDDSESAAGAVYMFDRLSDGRWVQMSYLKASNTDAEDRFGYRVALSDDGQTLAVSAPGESSGNSTSPRDNSYTSAGAVYVFERSGRRWYQRSLLKSSNAEADDSFGRGLALSGNGEYLAVGASGEASATTGINGNQADNSARASGAVYVFSRNGGHWVQQAYIKASNTDGPAPRASHGDRFGNAVALNHGGSVLAVGALAEHSAATGINGDQADNSIVWAGAAYVFARTGNTWNQQAYIKASNTDTGDHFGHHVALDDSGEVLVVGATHERSAAKGINGDQDDDSAQRAGAVYLFSRVAGEWVQQRYIKAPNSEESDRFGWVALSGDGEILAVGAPAESSGSSGINGNQADNSAREAGAVYLY